MDASGGCRAEAVCISWEHQVQCVVLATGAEPKAAPLPNAMSAETTFDEAAGRWCHLRVAQTPVQNVGEFCDVGFAVSAGGPRRRRERGGERANIIISCLIRLPKPSTL